MRGQNHFCEQPLIPEIVHMMQFRFVKKICEKQMMLIQNELFLRYKECLRDVLCLRQLRQKIVDFSKRIIFSNSVSTQKTSHAWLSLFPKIFPQHICLLLCYNRNKNWSPHLRQNLTPWKKFIFGADPPPWSYILTLKK